jgi:hypothetical protein
MEINYIGKVEDGAMIEAPVYETHARGKNWMATIEADPAAPGGLAREFVKNGRGRYLYLVGASLIGKAVEIAADYTSSGGKRHPKRWYGVVRNVTDSEISIEGFATADEAIKAARSWAAFDAQIRRNLDQALTELPEGLAEYYLDQTPVPNDHDALVEERERLQARIYEINLLLGEE